MLAFRVYEEYLGRMSPGVSPKVALPTAVKPDNICPGEHHTETISPFFFLISIRCCEPPSGSPMHGGNIQ